MKKTIMQEIGKDLKKIYSNASIYDDPRQIVYVQFTNFALPIKSEWKKLNKTGEEWVNQEGLSNQEQAVLNIDYIRKNNIQVYRSYNKRGRHLVFRCPMNEELYGWTVMHELKLPN